MDFFEEWLNKENQSKWIKRALTDKSYKNKAIRESLPEREINKDLATYGDAVIKLAYLELMLDKEEKITVKKSKVESDKFLVDKIARHYDLLKYIKKDDKNDKLPDSYDYEKYQSKNHNRCKYIATAVEALIGAIYKETNDLKKIVDLLDDWRKYS